MPIAARRVRFIVALSSGICSLATVTYAQDPLQIIMTAQRGYTHGDAPSGLARHVSLKLKPGWRFDRGRAQFFSASGQRFSVRDQLPEGSEIVPTAPALADTDPQMLSDAERDLARYVQLILPKGATPEHYLAIAKRWDAVEEATLPPRISLP